MKTIIEMAGKAFETPGVEPAFRNGFWTVTSEELERFAALVLANNPPDSSMAWQEGNEAGRLSEREAILDLVDSYAKNNTDLADAIRARGQA